MTITIYSKTGCPYCRQAKTALRNAGLAFTEIVVDDFKERQALYDRLGLGDGERTVPQIFFGDRRIGGYSDLCKIDLTTAAL